ncbi:hypothetical protein F4802DRAFT_588274, partial [Xylaria palmicola]
MAVQNLRVFGWAQVALSSLTLDPAAHTCTSTRVVPQLSLSLSLSLSVQHLERADEALCARSRAGYTRLNSPLPISNMPWWNALAAGWVMGVACTRSVLEVSSDSAVSARFFPGVVVPKTVWGV